MQIGKTVFRGAICAAMATTFLLPLTARADSWGFQVGGGFADHHSDHVQKIDLGAVWDPGLNWWYIGGWNFTTVVEGHAVYWNTNGNVHHTIGEFGVTPILRFEKSAGTIRPFVEAGVGLRLLTSPRVSESYTLSSGFQFADMVGVGVKFGGRMQYQVGYRFQHLSNAGIKRPNPGIDFHSVYVQYNF